MHINTGCPTKHDESRLWFLNLFWSTVFHMYDNINHKIIPVQNCRNLNKINLVCVLYWSRAQKGRPNFGNAYFLSINYTEFYLKFATVMYRGTTFTRELRKVSNLQNSFKGTVFNFGFHNISLTMGLINWMII